MKLTGVVGVKFKSKLKKQQPERFSGNSGKAKAGLIPAVALMATLAGEAPQAQAQQKQLPAKAQVVQVQKAPEAKPKHLTHPVFEKRLSEYLGTVKGKTLKEQLTRLKALGTPLQVGQRVMYLKDQAVREAKSENYEEFRKALKSTYQKAEKDKTPIGKETKERIESILWNAVLKEPDPGWNVWRYYANQSRAESMGLLAELKGNKLRIFPEKRHELFLISGNFVGDVFKAIPIDAKAHMLQELFDETEWELAKEGIALEHCATETAKCLGLINGSSSAKELKELMTTAGKSYKNLIGAYVKDFDRAKHEEPLVRLFNFRRLLFYGQEGALAYVPPKMFNPQWYKHTDSMLKIADKLEPGSEQRTALLHVLEKMAVLEMQHSSGIKKPKIYGQLVDLLKKSPQKNWPELGGVLTNCIEQEAAINHTEKNKRILATGLNRNYLNTVKPSEKLLKPILDQIEKGAANIPGPKATGEEVAAYKAVRRTASQLLFHPIFDNRGVILWQKPVIEHMVKLPVKQRLPWLKWHQDVSPMWKHILARKADKVAIAGFKQGVKSVFISTLEETKKGTPESMKLARESLDILVPMWARGADNAHSKPFQQDKDVQNAIRVVLNDYKKTPLSQSEKLKDYSAVVAHCLELIDPNDTKTLELAYEGLAKQLEYGAQQLQQAKGAQQLKIAKQRQIDMLGVVTNIVKPQFNPWHYHAASRKFPLTLPLYKAVGKYVLKGNQDPDITVNGLSMLNWAWMYSKPEDIKAQDELIENVVYPDILVPIAKQVQYIPTEEKQQFVHRLYQTAMKIFPLNKGDDVLRGKVLKTLTSACFTPDPEDEFQSFLGFASIALSPDTSQIPRMDILSSVLSQQKGYVENQFKYAGEHLQKGTPKQQQRALKSLDDFYTVVHRINEYYKKEAYKKYRTQAVNDTLLYSAKSTGQCYFDYLKNVRVTAKLNALKTDRIVDQKQFETLLPLIEKVVQDHPGVAMQCLRVIDARLADQKTTVPEERGMLYKTMAVLPLKMPDVKGYPTLERFEKALSTEPLIVNRYIGHAFGKLFVRECTEDSFSGDPRKAVFLANLTGTWKQQKEAKAYMENWKKHNIGTENAKRVEQPLPVQEAILGWGKAAHAHSTMLKKLMESNPKADIERVNKQFKLLNDNFTGKRKASEKEIEVAQKEVEQFREMFLYPILNNGSTRLGAFAEGLLLEKRRVKRDGAYHIGETFYSIKHANSYPVTYWIDELTKGIPKQIQRSLSWAAPAHHVGSRASSLERILSAQPGIKLVDYEDRMNQLALRLFDIPLETLYKNKEERQRAEKLIAEMKEKKQWRDPLFETYNQGLHSRFLWARVEELNKKLAKTKDDYDRKAIIETRDKFRGMDKYLSRYNPGQTKYVPDDVADFFRKYDRDKYYEEVTKPYRSLRISFVRRFLDSAPPGQREERLRFMKNWGIIKPLNLTQDEQRSILVLQK